MKHPPKWNTLLNETPSLMKHPPKWNTLLNETPSLMKHPSKWNIQGITLYAMHSECLSGSNFLFRDPIGFYCRCSSWLIWFSSIWRVDISIFVSSSILFSTSFDFITTTSICHYAWLKTFCDWAITLLSLLKNVKVEKTQLLV